MTPKMLSLAYMSANIKYTQSLTFHLTQQQEVDILHSAFYMYV